MAIWKQVAAAVKECRRGMVFLRRAVLDAVFGKAISAVRAREVSEAWRGSTSSGTGKMAMRRKNIGEKMSERVARIRIEARILHAAISGIARKVQHPQLSLAWKRGVVARSCRAQHAAPHVRTISFYGMMMRDSSRFISFGFEGIGRGEIPYSVLSATGHWSAAIPSDKEKPEGRRCRRLSTRRTCRAGLSSLF